MANANEEPNYTAVEFIANEEPNYTAVEFIGLAPGMQRTCFVDPQDDVEAPLVPAEGQHTPAQTQLYLCVFLFRYGDFGNYRPVLDSLNRTTHFCRPA
jgi:hypothetical protein